MSSPVRKILVVKLSSLGDVVHGTGPVRALKRKFPEAAIWLVVERRYQPIFENNPYLTGIIGIEDRGHGRIAHLRMILEKQCGLGFDLAIDLHGNSRSSPWIYASRATKMVGLAKGPRLGWEIAFQHDYSYHAIEELEKFFFELGIQEDLSPEIFLSPQVNPNPLPGPYVVLNPFASKPSKCWPLEAYGELAELLVQRGLNVVTTGAPSEVPRMKEGIKFFPKASFQNLVGKLTLSENFWVWKNAHYMITGDTGPMHIADALGTKLLALFGTSWPPRTAPWNQRENYLQGIRPPHFHYENVDQTDTFIREIKAEKVYEIVSKQLRLMEGNPRPQRFYPLGQLNESIPL